MTTTEKRWACLAADDIASDGLFLYANDSRTRTVPVGNATGTGVRSEAARCGVCGGRELTAGGAQFSGCMQICCSNTPAWFPYRGSAAGPTRFRTSVPTDQHNGGLVRFPCVRYRYSPGAIRS